MSLMILGTSTALGQPVFPGSLLDIVLKKDSHTYDEMLCGLYVLNLEIWYKHNLTEMFCKIPT